MLLGHRVESIEPGGRVRARGRGTGERDAGAPTRSCSPPPHREAFAAAPALADTPVARRAGLGATPDRQRARRLRPPGHRPAVRRGRRLARAVVLRPHRHLRAAPHAPGGQYLAITVSAADDVIDEPEPRRCSERFVAELARLLPAARRAEVLDAFVTRERRATFRQAAGSARAAARPAAPGSTGSGWPARGRPPAGPTRWKARCAAGSPRPTRRWTCRPPARSSR